LLEKDAPAHHVFVLLPPTDHTSNTLPEILAVVQIALEGEISRKSILAGLARGERASGDLIPWTIAQQVTFPFPFPFPFCFSPALSPR